MPGFDLFLAGIHTEGGPAPCAGSCPS